MGFVFSVRDLIGCEHCAIALCSHNESDGAYCLWYLISEIAGYAHPRSASSQTLWPTKVTHDCLIHCGLRPDQRRILYASCLFHSPLRISSYDSWRHWAYTNIIHAASQKFFLATIYVLFATTCNLKSTPAIKDVVLLSRLMVSTSIYIYPSHFPPLLLHKTHTRVPFQENKSSKLQALCVCALALPKTSKMMESYLEESKTEFTPGHDSLFCQCPKTPIQFAHAPAHLSHTSSASGSINPARPSTLPLPHPHTFPQNSKTPPSTRNICLPSKSANSSPSCIQKAPRINIWFCPAALQLARNA